MGVNWFFLLKTNAFFLDFGRFECDNDNTNCRLLCNEGYNSPMVVSAK